MEQWSLPPDRGPGKVCKTFKNGVSDQREYEDPGYSEGSERHNYSLWDHMPSCANHHLCYPCTEGKQRDLHVDPAATPSEDFLWRLRISRIMMQI